MTSDDRSIREWAGYMADLSEMAEFLDHLTDRDDVEITEIRTATESIRDRAVALLERMRDTDRKPD